MQHNKPSQNIPMRPGVHRPGFQLGLQVQEEPVEVCKRPAPASAPTPIDPSLNISFYPIGTPIPSIGIRSNAQKPNHQSQAKLVEVEPVDSKKEHERVEKPRQESKSERQSEIEARTLPRRASMPAQYSCTSPNSFGDPEPQESLKSHFERMSGRRASYADCLNLCKQGLRYGIFVTKYTRKNHKHRRIMWADENFDVLYLAPPPSKSYTRLSEGSEEKPRRASLLGQFFRSKSSIGRRLPSVSSARVFQLANAVEVRDGKETDNLQKRSAKSAIEACCVSIVFHDGYTLDLEFDSVIEHDMMLEGLDLLVKLRSRCKNKREEEDEDNEDNEDYDDE